MKSRTSKSASHDEDKPKKEVSIQSTSFPVVAIGASAGGLEAYTEFFHALPADTGMAFVLVQHLDPSHHSMLADILAKATRMPVEEVKPGIKVKPNCVYVIPANAFMAIADGILMLTPRKKGSAQHLAVNFFMRSLAEERKSGAIGIVLSGTGADGTSGMEDIKAEGGLTFAQEPASAKYDGMPRSAIDSGCVDFILRPKEIARELARIHDHPYVLKQEKSRAERGQELGDSIAPPQPRDKDFASILDQLRKTSGVDFSQYKPNTIHRRTLRRMVILKQDSLGEYAKHLKEHPEEASKLFDDVLIPVTSFFRDFEAFEALKTQVYPAIVKDKGNKGTIRMWAPGCSTGEETYSLAMTLLEFLGDKAASFQVQIFGTDLNEKGIQHARAGVYRESIAEEISPERMSRFFVKVEEGYRVNKAVRDMCVFARQNLANDPPFSQMNVVACRNLLIYIQPVLQKKIIPILHYALKPSGFLVLGSSESVSAFPDLFSTVDKKHKIYGKKAIASRLHYDFVQSYYPAYPAGSRQDVPGKGLKSAAPARDDLDVQTEADRVVLKNHAPVGVVINSAMEVVQYRGRTTPYLEAAPGKPSLNVLKLARNGLSITLRTLIAAAAKKGAPVNKYGITFDDNGHPRTLNLSVTPLGTEEAKKKGPPDNRFYLVLFEDVTPQWASDPKDGASRKGKATASTLSAQREAKRLKQEVAGAQDALRSAIESEDALKEEFQSANEEILSANEELQSTNEELETSKEELQSANEELNTLNAELRSKNSDLHDLSNDISNFLNSTRIPVVMLDRGLRIRRLTPTADKLLKVLPSDIGRPLADIRPNIEVPELEQSVAKVLESFQPEEREVRDLQGHWYSLNILPYRTQDNKIDGVVLALQDVDAIKGASEQLRKSADFFKGVVDTVREPLLVLDPELRVISANRPFLSTFQVSAEQTVNRFLYDLGNGQWNIPKLRALLEQVLPKMQAVTDFEVERDFESIGRRTMLLNARRLAESDGTQAMILLAIEDVTERHQAAEAVARLAAIVESSDDAIIRKDLNGIIESWNPGAERIFGYTSQEAVGQSITMLMPPDRVHEEAEILGHIRKGESVDHFESVRRRKDGELRDISLTISPIFDADGRVIGTSKIARDVTERNRVEAALREGEERYRTLFDLGPVAVYSCDAAGIIQNFNRRAVELWGREPALGDTDERFCGSFKLFRPDGSFMPHEQCPMAEVVSGKISEARDAEVLIERPDGSRVTVVVNIRPLKNVRGEISGGINCFYDISERKQAEVKLRESEKRYRELINALPVAVYTTDAEGTITLYNEAAEAFAGRRAQAGKDQWCVTHRLYRPDGSFLPHDECPMAVTLRTGKPQLGVEAIAERPDGTRAWFIPHPTLVRDSSGAIIGGINVLVDITERRLAEAALIKSEKLAAAGRLAATLAHEINNPLQAVTNLMTLLGRSPGLDAQEQGYAAMAEQELSRVVHLTQQSLSFYRESIYATEVNLEEALDSVLNLYTKRIEDKGINVNRRYQSDGTTINSYPGEIRQVFSTLLMNAMEATNTGGAIEIFVRKSSWWGNSAIRGVRITIADTGVGISTNNMTNIFEPFFTTKGEQGTGLGLWVANGIINRLGGSIQLRSSTRPGKSGTCFSIFLPIGALASA